jgi:hypothetical protein
MTDVWFELLPENVQKLFLKEVEALECNAFKTPYEKRKKDEANSDQVAKPQGFSGPKILEQHFQRRPFSVPME